MPAGPFLGIDYAALLRRRGARNARQAAPPHAVLLAPARQHAYDVEVHRGGVATAASSSSQAGSEEAGEEAGEAGGEAPTPASRRAGVDPRVVFVALCAWLALGLHAVPPAHVAFALAFPAYLWAANTWRFSRNAAARDRPMLPMLPGACRRSLREPQTRRADTTRTLLTRA
jgi:hypothetical protein